LEPVPYKLPTLLTDQAIEGPIGPRSMARGIQFVEQPRNRSPILSRQSRFDMICEANKIEHRLTKAQSPVDQRPRRADEPHDQDVTAKRYHYLDHEQLRRHLDLFPDAYNHARRLTTIEDLAPARSNWKPWQARSELFFAEPCHLMAKLNS
jgi:hypothetical protein